MIEPERWYEYQKNYQRYGFDMKPQPEKQPRQRERKQARIKLPTLNGKKMAMSAVLLISIGMIMAIIVTSYCANLRYDINTMIKENNVLKGDIENLQATLYSTNNINYIEKSAISGLGMTYPEAANKVYISREDMPEKGFSAVLKEKAYN